MLLPLADARTAIAVTAERAFARRLSGSCHTPLAGYAHWDGASLWLRGLVASRDGRHVLRGEKAARIADESEARAVGDALGGELLARGAAAILAG